MKQTKFKRILILILLIFFNLTTISFADAPELKSEAAILFETSTGNVLYQKNATERLYPASTTKILTAIIVIEECDLNEIATVSKNAVALVPAGYSNGGLIAGEEMSVKDLLYALMLNSANEAANVLAEHVSGNIEDFTKLMNEKATAIGCTDSHFTNTNGMHDENHYTTAADLARIADYCMKNETFREIVSTYSYPLPSTNKYSKTDRIMKNTNQLINPLSKHFLMYAIGIKTGFTSQAGNCLIAAVQKDDVELISVTLKAGSSSKESAYRFTDSKALLEYGLDNFDFVKITERNTLIDTIKIENATEETKDLKITIKEDVTDFINTNLDIEETNIEITQNLTAPINKGDIVGTATYTAGEKTYTVELIADNNVIEKTYYEIYIAIGIGAFLSIIIITIIIIKIKKKNKFTYKF